MHLKDSTQNWFPSFSCLANIQNLGDFLDWQTMANERFAHVLEKKESNARSRF